MPAYNRTMTIADVLAMHIGDPPLMSLTAAADLFDVSQPTITRWLAGTDTPSAKRVPALIEFTGLREDQVLAAIQRQRAGKRSIPQRVSDLELRVRELSSQVRSLLDAP